MGYFKYPIKRPDSAKNNFSVFKIVNFKNTEICLNKFQTKIIFGNVLCKVHRTSLSSQIFFFMMKRLVKILVLFVDFAKLDKWQKLRFDGILLSIPSSALTAPKIILVFLKLSILKTLKLFEQISDQNYFWKRSNVKVQQNKSFITNFFFMMKRLVKILVLFVDFAKLDKWQKLRFDGIL